MRIPEQNVKFKLINTIIVYNIYFCSPKFNLQQFEGKKDTFELVS